MAEAPSLPPPIRFAGWELRPAQRQLLVDDLPVPVGSRAFDVLLALVARRGELVRKSELLDAVWPGLVVEENNVSVQIATLRKWLGRSSIATVPGMGYRLSAVALADVIAAPAPRPASGFDLIGREVELARLSEWVGRAAVVTLVGAGGVGKTSIAREAWRRHAAVNPEAAHWMDLAPIREPAELLPALAQALGVDLGGASSAQDAAEVLLTALSRMRALVALDNCEHLSDAVARLLHQAVSRAPAVRWLATSQVPLHVPGEQVERLQPLAVPPQDASVIEALEYGALALLCQRAAAADAGFRLEPGMLPAAIALCRTLDGLPLALEMAAARMATLGLDEISTQLGEKLRLRGPASTPRHQTVRATFDWSYSLLSPAEQTVFRRLAPFLGGFRMAQAGQVVLDTALQETLGDVSAVDVIAALLDKSLVQRSVGAPGRFHLLETARDYAWLRLEEAGESDATQSRHALAMAAASASAAEDGDELADAPWCSRYLPERANVRAALTWAVEAGPPDVLAQLMAAFAVLDTLMYREAEVLRLVMPLERLAQARPALRARAFLELSWAHYTDGSREQGTLLALQARDDFLALGNGRGAYRATAQLIRLYESRPGMQDAAERARQELQGLGGTSLPLRVSLFCSFACGAQRREERTIDMYQVNEELAQRAGFDVLASVCRVLITNTLLIAGRFEEVVEVSERALKACTPFPRLLATLLQNRVLALVRLGREAPARESAHRALRTLPSAVGIFDAFAFAAANAGRLSDAALLHGYAHQRRTERDAGLDPAEAAAITETLSLLGAGLAVQPLSDLRRLGSTLTDAQAMALAQLQPAQWAEAKAGNATVGPDQGS
jgi:predicted ATPase/DNA-binding winged helix-turn-helix (wHTH) protein